MERNAAGGRLYTQRYALKDQEEEEEEDYWNRTVHIIRKISKWNLNFAFLPPSFRRKYNNDRTRFSSIYYVVLPLVLFSYLLISIFSQSYLTISCMREPYKIKTTDYI